MINLKIVLCTLTAVAAMGCLGGCAFSWKTSYIYENGDKYQAGDRDISEKIDSIVVDYMSGDVTLTDSDSGNVTIRETSRKELDDKRKVHTWVDGTTLYVKFCASEKALDLNNLHKELTIGVPAGMELDELKMKISSGDVDVSCIANDFDLHTSSGKIRLAQRGNSHQIKLHTSSGSVNVEAENADNMDVSVSSGKIFVNAENIRTINSRTSSGRSEYSFAMVPETSELSASSGDITVTIPENADLSAKLKTSSGKVYTEHAFSQDGDTYLCGNGRNQMDVHTSSGDVTIK